MDFETVRFLRQQQNLLTNGTDSRSEQKTMTKARYLQAQLHISQITFAQHAENCKAFKFKKLDLHN